MAEDDKARVWFVILGFTTHRELVKERKNKQTYLIILVKTN